MKIAFLQNPGSGRKCVTAALLALAILAVGAIDPAQDPPPPGDPEGCFFVLTRSADGFAMEKIPLADGEVKVLPLGPDSGYIDVIAPVAPGGSGSIAQVQAGDALIVRHVDGELRSFIQTASGERHERPGILFDALHGYDIRVSVLGSENSGRAMLIRKYESWTYDDCGPVLDIFAGKLPFELSDDQFIICTDTVMSHTGTLVSGTIPFTHDRHLYTTAVMPNGVEATLIIDLGGAITALVKDLLPEGAEIRPASSIQFSGAKRQLLPYEPGGATGAIQSVLGHSTISSLRFGDVEFGEADVTVFDSMPDIFGREVHGILGIDLLKRARGLRLSFTNDEAGTGKIEFVHPAAQAAAEDEPATRIPFTYVKTHIMLRGNVDGQPIFFVIDTGSPGILLDGQAARAIGVEPADEEQRQARGLDEGAVAVYHGSIERLTLGGQDFNGLPCAFADLAAFDTLRTHDQNAALLGNSFFARLGSFVVDFENRELIWRRH